MWSIYIYIYIFMPNSIDLSFFKNISLCQWLHNNYQGSFVNCSSRLLLAGEKGRHHLHIKASTKMPRVCPNLWKQSWEVACTSKGCWIRSIANAKLENIGDMDHNNPLRCWIMFRYSSEFDHICFCYLIFFSFFERECVYFFLQV